MFGFDIIGLKPNQNLMTSINRSLFEMKTMGNLFKTLSLIDISDSSKSDNFHEAKLIGIKYNADKKNLYLKWLVDDSIKISDTLHNPLIEQTELGYLMTNRLDSSLGDQISLELNKKYLLNIKFMILNSLKTPKVCIEYFSL
jgi:hypothetical protein